MLKVCIEEKVPCIETAAYSPDEYAERIKKAGMTWVHKAASVRHLVHAEKIGADAVVLVGRDGRGFKNIRQLPTFTSIAWASRQLKVPLVAAGGIGDARTFLAALAAGAEGVYMGTAFLITKECPMSDRIKENIIKAEPDHPDLIREALAPPNPKEYEEIMSLRGKMPFEKWVPALERVMYKHEEWRDVKPMWEQTVDDLPSLGSRPKGPYSFACAYLDRIVSCQELIDGIVKGAEEILKGWVNQFKLA